MKKLFRQPIVKILYGSKNIFSLMYLPVTCEMRLTDMRRGIIALNIIYQNGEDILFFGTTMKQIRNNRQFD